MAYQHIDNLYKEQQILMFKECYAMEKIHGTSAHISYKNGRVGLFAGGSNHEDFVKLFDADALKSKFDEIFPNSTSCHIYGEAYGGKLQGMSKTYGDKLRFVTFEVKIGDAWLNVPKAEDFVKGFGLEFVHYNLIPTTMEAINAERDADSVQAIRNGVGEGHMREGIVLRPLEEVILNSGKRVIAKHKRDEFRETRTPREISPDKLKQIAEAKAIANEWVTRERLNHVINRLEAEACNAGDGLDTHISIEQTGKVIALMTEDILREAEGEIVDSPDARKHIGRETALMFKEYLNEGLKGTNS